MFGFLNVCIAAALAVAGASVEETVPVLRASSADDVTFSDAGIEWRGRLIGVPALAETRRRLLRSFGSCSFDEPVQDLTRLGLL